MPDTQYAYLSFFLVFQCNKDKAIKMGVGFSWMKNSHNKINYGYSKKNTYI